MVTGIYFIESGNKVPCVDIDQTKIEIAEGLQKTTITLKHCHYLSGLDCQKNLFQNNIICKSFHIEDIGR